MSVLYDDHQAAAVLECCCMASPASGPPHCFVCDERLTLPMVCWVGVNVVLLHAKCAAFLGPHLIADAREAMLAGASGVHWRRRAIAAVRHRLVVEENSAA